MNPFANADLPTVSLSRDQRLRLLVVALLVVVALGRVIPDLARLLYPLQSFGYATDANGVVVLAPSNPPKGTDRLQVGDRVMISRIKPFDRKPGIERIGYTYDNPSRYLPIVRNGRERIVHLTATPEGMPSRIVAVIRVVLFWIVVGLGAVLYLMKPSIATGAFFFYCLSAEAPATWLDLLIPNPWRQIPIWLDLTLRGAGRSALLLFALCLIDGDRDTERERVFAWVTGLLGLALGSLQAYGYWRETFAALPGGRIAEISQTSASTISVLTVIVFILAWLRARGVERVHTTWIALAFAAAAGARVASDTLFPTHIPLWFNGILLSFACVPAVVVWIAVIRDRYFNVDFVVSKAIVYAALTGAGLGSIYILDEVISFIFYNVLTVNYVLYSIIAITAGMMTGSVLRVLNYYVDRFIFRGRHAQREALKFISGYILDAETEDDVYRALLQDASHALNLHFAGILTRRPDGSYELAQQYNWPDDCVVRLASDAPLVRAMSRSRGVLDFSGKDSALIREAFPHERLSFAAPIFFNRTVSAIVVYGHNIAGLNLDPDERELLITVVQHASIVLNEIELSHYRQAVEALSVPLLGNG